MDIKTETEQLIAKIVNDTLSDYAVDACNIEAKKTSDGEDAIYVGVCYHMGETAVIDPAVTTSLLTKLNEELLAIGEERFTYIRHYLSEDHKIRGNWNVCGTTGHRKEVSM